MKFSKKDFSVLEWKISMPFLSNKVSHRASGLSKYDFHIRGTAAQN